MTLHLETPIPVELIQTLERQKYHLIGRHSAVKRCRWLHQALTNGRSCYKQKFYGVQSHRCIQMTPTAFYCTQQCVFCWRAQNTDLRLTWNELAAPDDDGPEQIVEASIIAQRRILSGYKANPKTDMKKLKEAQNPNQAAISLAGEPTLYRRLRQLLRAFHKKKFTTFLVSNGTIPSALANLDEEPTQLYISACAPDKKTFNEVCRPQIPNAWKNLKKHSRFCPASNARRS